MRKTTVNNPRYPHHIRIVRKLVSDWLDNTVPGASSDGSDTEPADETIVIYCGPGRSYTDTTTTGDAKVDTNKRKASIPVRFDKWPLLPSEPEWDPWSESSSDAPQTSNLNSQTSKLIPMSGDILYVTKANITEQWEVKDFEPDNDRSIVYGELNRNFNIE